VGRRHILATITITAAYAHRGRYHAPLAPDIDGGGGGGGVEQLLGRTYARGRLVRLNGKDARRRRRRRRRRRKINTASKTRLIT